MLKHLSLTFDCPKIIGQYRDWWGGMRTGFDNYYFENGFYDVFWATTGINLRNFYCITSTQITLGNKILFIRLKSLDNWILELEGDHENSFLLLHFTSLPSAFARFLIRSSLWIGKMVIVALGFQDIQCFSPDIMSVKKKRILIGPAWGICQLWINHNSQRFW